MATFTATTNPMIITSAATISVGSVTRPINAKLIELVGATAGSTCVIADLNGNTICAGVTSVLNQTAVLWPGPIKLVLPGKQASFAGTGQPGGSWQVSTITSGQLY